MSTDKTKEIAAKFTDKIYEILSMERRFCGGPELCLQASERRDYILWLDADDIYWKRIQQKLRKLKEDVDRSGRRRVDVVSHRF